MRLQWAHVDLGLREAFVNSRGTTRAVPQTIVTVARDGLLGRGGFVRGLDRRDHDRELDVAARLVAGATPHDLDEVLDALEAALPGGSAVLSGVDTALHDLLGRTAGRPLHALFGLPRCTARPTAVSIGACSGSVLLDRVAALAGHPVLKLKLTAVGDVDRIRCVRERHPGRLWVDANGCLTLDEAVEVARRLHELGVELLEQPLAPRSWEALRVLHERSPLPLVADEDFVGADDVPDLCGRVDVVNVKVGKCGGLRRSLAAARAARRAGLGVMIGCRAESTVGVVAAAHLAGLADFLDLDGHLDVVDDPYTGLRVENGLATVPASPGSGAVPAPGRLVHPEIESMETEGTVLT